MVSNVEDKLHVDRDANDAGDWCEGECGMQEDFAVPFDSSLRREKEVKDGWYNFSGSR